MLNSCYKICINFQSAKRNLTNKIFYRVDHLLSDNSFAWCVTPISQVALTQSVWLLLLFSPYMPDAWPIFVSLLTLLTGILTYRYFYSAVSSKKESSLFLRLWITAMLTVLSAILLFSLASLCHDFNRFYGHESLYDE
jgi:hypothetical protein